MAPSKQGKETLFELCTSTISLGNSISVRCLEYLSDARTVRNGFRDLTIEFLEASRPLFPTKTGLTEASSAGTQFPADAKKDLVGLFRQYHTNYVVLDQMVSKILANEKKHGFSKIGKGFSMMFADSDIEKLKSSLLQCRDAASNNMLIQAWMRRDVGEDATAWIGYTALAAVLGRQDPTRNSARSQSQKAATVAVTDLSPHHQNLPLRPALKQYGSPPQLPQTQLQSPVFPRTADLLGRDSLTMSPSGSRSTAESQFTQLSLRSRAVLNDDISEISPPSSVSVGDEMFSRDMESPKQAIRIKVDPSSVPRWRPKNVAGAVSAGAKQALFVAVQELNHEMVEHLLDSGVPADHGPDTNLLRMAVINHDIACVRLLLLFGADPNAKDKEDYTPLYAATKEFFIEAAQLLLKYGADPNISAGPKQENPLALAITDGRATFAHLFLKHGADPHITMGNTDTPFTQAMNRTTTTNLIDLMLTYDSNVNTKNGHGETALFKAINAERLDLVNILLDNGAQPNLPGPKHMLWPAVHRPQILALLLERGADLKRAPGCLELATSIISTESVQILLANGADPNAKKDGIFTPLCTAIRDDRGQLVDILLAAGADPNLMASEYPAWKCVTHHRAHLLPRVLAAGADPTKPAGIIEKAVECKNKEALRILLDERVNPNARNESGCTALTTAIRLQDLEAIDTLLAYGADPSVRGQEWPITMAVKHPEILAKLLPHVPVSRIPKGVLERSVQANQLESIKLLLAAGVDCEDKNGGVFSPLTTSIREDRKEIFQYLLDTVGCDPNSPGEHLPIIKAIRRHRENDLSYIRALLAKGADINLMYRGWNAVLQALDQGDTQTLRLLAEMGTPDLHARDEDGMSVLEIMQDRGMKEEERILSKGRESPTGDMAGAFRELRDFVKE
ncbi:ankyrin [Hortaea werneckii]|uniref:NACHT-NTPase and P-loop NTPases N-terminal domain-containing protein n=2 Tax=Hortaea werneckii TaxID=91943 RepID=A0A3M7IAV5_HORWE|nr:ankyrin [Hortaea werneckii]OTA20268.1 hypothetical protein BTJ68_14929 [Hortaea werneckii EXF-2000]KAI6825900.1 ankyrin [Hortaea werneckii]KAI6923742.1 ankyrin [Hortaea werneckii]KAI6924654.1 ankyrin [Hortaea werneckii]